MERWRELEKLLEVPSAPLGEPSMSHGALAEFAACRVRVATRHGATRLSSKGSGGKNRPPLEATAVAETALVCVKELSTRSTVTFSTSHDHFHSYRTHVQVTVF